jgi:hypothetical protein
VTSRYAFLSQKQTNLNTTPSPQKQRLLRLDAPPVRLKVLNNASGVIKPVRRAIAAMVVVMVGTRALGKRALCAKNEETHYTSCTSLDGTNKHNPRFESSNQIKHKTTPNRAA